MALSITDMERHNLLDAIAEVQAECIKVGQYLSLATAMGDSGAAIHGSILYRETAKFLLNLQGAAGMTPQLPDA